MCRFCENFEFNVEIAMHSEFGYVYSAALVEHGVVNGKLRGRTVHYMKDGVGFPLNYCPECGRKLLED